MKRKRKRKADGGGDGGGEKREKAGMRRAGSLKVVLADKEGSLALLLLLFP